MTSHRQRIIDLVARYERPFEDPMRHRDIAKTLWDGHDGELARLRARTASKQDVEYALAYLELDPYYFRSGYTKKHVLRHLVHAPMNHEQRARGRRIVLDAVDGTRFCWEDETPKFAGAVADNDLRRELRARLHRRDFTTRRAAIALTGVRHPGYTASDTARLREIALRWVEHRSIGLSPRVYLLVTRLWCPEWKAELESIAGPHGPDRAAARSILETMERRREHRERKRAGL